MKTKNHILRSVTAAALLLAFTAIPSAYAQDTAIEQAADNVQHVKQTFSREGRRSWYPEVSVDGHAMIWMASADLAIGARTDNDRVFGLGGGVKSKSGLIGFLIGNNSLKIVHLANIKQAVQIF